MAKAKTTGKGKQGLQLPKKIKVPAIGGLFKPCGYRIFKGATAGYTLAADECAFCTYVLEATAVGLPQPTVAFYGPGQNIVRSFGGGSVTYVFLAGVVFKNCASGRAAD